MLENMVKSINCSKGDCEDGFLPIKVKIDIDEDSSKDKKAKDKR